MQGTLISECSLRVLESQGPVTKSNSGQENILAGFVWGSRQPMPSTGRGIVSAYYRNCLRTCSPSAHSADGAPSSLQSVNAQSTADRANITPPPERHSVSLSRWAAHLEGADEGGAAASIASPVSNRQSTTSPTSRSNPSDDARVGIAAPSDTTAIRVADSPSAIHPGGHQAAPAIKITVRNFLAFFSERNSGDFIDRFLRIRGFSVAKSDGESVQPVSHSRILAPEDRVSAVTDDGTPDLESVLKLELLTPSSAILATFFAGIFVLEFGGALDIYADFGSLFGAPETDASLAVILLLFVVAMVRFAMISGHNFTCSHRVPANGVQDRRPFVWRAGPHSWDNIVVVVSWTLLVGALTAQVQFD